MEKVSLETIKLAQQGDEQAFKKIYELNYSHVFYYALKLSQSDADAKDITQETFLQIYQSIGDLKNPQYFPLWLNRIVNSKYIRLVSKRKATAMEKDALYHLIDEQNQEENVPVLTDEDVVRRMICSLTPKQSEILDMMYYKQYTIKEMAQLLNLPEGTIKSRVFQAKLALKPKIHEFEKIEGRSLTFKLDLLVPFSIFALLPRLKNMFQNAGALQGVAMASMASLVLVSSVAVVETASVIEQYHIPNVSKAIQPTKLKQFQPVAYEHKTIQDARTAYYELMAWAPDALHVQAKSKAEKEQLYPVLQNLMNSDNNYRKQLEDSGWLAAYNF